MTVSYVVGASLSPPSSARPCAAAAHDVADCGDRGGCEGAVAAARARIEGDGGRMDGIRRLAYGEAALCWN